VLCSLLLSFSFFLRKNKRGGDVSIKEKREKEKESQEKRKEKITKKRLKRNGGIEGRSSSELES
jgi:hypothetical protein